MIQQQPFPYKCSICGGWFVHGNLQCLVAHPPGTCCHEHDTPVVVRAIKGGAYKPGDVVETSEV